MKTMNLFEKIRQSYIGTCSCLGDHTCAESLENALIQTNTCDKCPEKAVIITGVDVISPVSPDLNYHFACEKHK